MMSLSPTVIALLFISSAYADLMSEIVKANTDYAKSYNKQDPKFPEFVTEDVDLLPAMGHKIHGRKAWISFLATVDYRPLTMNVEKVNPCGENKVTAIGTFSGSKKYTGSFLQIWTKENGSWKISEGAWILDNPPQDADLMSEIVKATSEYANSYNKQDPKFPEFVTEEVDIFPAMGHKLHGRKAWISFLAKNDYRPLAVNVEKVEPLAENKVTATGTFSGNKKTGSYLQIWTKENGSWKISQLAWILDKVPGHPEL